MGAKATRKEKKTGLDKLHEKLGKVKEAPRRLLHIDPIDIECCFEKDAVSGGIHMKVGLAGGELEQGGKKVGSVYGCLGGGLEVAIDGYTYYLGMVPLWNAVVSAHERWKKEQGK